MKSSILGIMMLLLVSADVTACSCGMKTLEDHIDSADAVYLATLQQAKLVKGEYGKAWPSVEGTFEVRKTLKSQVHGASITLATPMPNASCGVSMVVSAPYLIFMRKGSNSISACDGSSVIETFQEDEVAARVKAALKPRENNAARHLAPMTTGESNVALSTDAINARKDTGCTRPHRPLRQGVPPGATAGAPGSLTP